MDVHDKKTRSYNMSQIKGKNTKPEEMVRKYLFAQGFRYRKNDKKLPGTPDIVLPKYKTVIFVNGCFWHGHEGCKYFVWPKSNPDFWKKERTNCNCGGFALNTQSWVCPYDHDEEYTDDSRTQIIRDMYEEGFSKEAIMEAIMILDQESLLRSCSWIEPVLPEEI